MIENTNFCQYLSVLYQSVSPYDQTARFSFLRNCVWSYVYHSNVCLYACLKYVYLCCCQCYCYCDFFLQTSMTSDFRFYCNKKDKKEKIEERTIFEFAEEFFQVQVPFLVLKFKIGSITISVFLYITQKRNFYDPQIYYSDFDLDVYSFHRGLCAYPYILDRDFLCFSRCFPSLYHENLYLCYDVPYLCPCFYLDVLYPYPYHDDDLCLYARPCVFSPRHPDFCPTEANMKRKNIIKNNNTNNSNDK